ncbi:MAG: hypothetical protein JWN11_1063, partial [Hyphomicrobiales bacterium]|nr:hypothetical protein [Hyphomicrobiales bacterium]
MASKYAPLADYLTRHRGQKLRMTFEEIEEVLGFRLPTKSKHVRAWWSNNPHNNVMTAAWLAAGFKTEQVDVAGEVLVFAPTEENNGFAEMAQAQFDHAAKLPAPEKAPDLPRAEKKAATFPRSSIFGSMKGTTIVAPGVDLTAP